MSVLVVTVTFVGVPREVGSDSWFLDISPEEGRRDSPVGARWRRPDTEGRV